MPVICNLATRKATSKRRYFAEDEQTTTICNVTLLWQANVAPELVVCHVLLGATGAAERLLHRERDEGFTAWLPSDHKVRCMGGCCLVMIQNVG